MADFMGDGDITKAYRKQIQQMYKDIPNLDWKFLESGGTQATEISKLRRIVPVLYHRAVNRHLLSLRLAKHDIREQHQKQTDGGHNIPFPVTSLYDYPKVSDRIPPNTQAEVGSQNILLRDLRSYKIEAFVKSEYISIYNLDGGETHVKTTEQFRFQTVPISLAIKPESKVVAIASMGRNNPHYHFTGSEDTLEFSVSWYATEESREDVIRNCRYLESLTKANGYLASLPRLKLFWGSKNYLFKDHIWIMVAAPYELKGFSRGYKDNDGNIVNTNMLPTYATQNITLKRISAHNLTTKEIRY